MACRGSAAAAFSKRSCAARARNCAASAGLRIEARRFHVGGSSALTATSSAAAVGPTPSLPRNSEPASVINSSGETAAAAVTVETIWRSLRPAAEVNPTSSRLPGRVRTQDDKIAAQILSHAGERIRCQSVGFRQREIVLYPSHVFSGMVSSFSPAASSLVSISESQSRAKRFRHARKGS